MSFQINISKRECADLPLASLVVGRASALEVELVNVPDDVDNIQLHIARPGSSETTAAGANAKPGGVWRAYINGGYFPIEGTARYYVTARDVRGGSVFLGSGWLRIIPSVLNVSDAPVPTLPDDVMLRGTDGRYYPLTIEFDHDGVPMPVIGDGVTK